MLTFSQFCAKHGCSPAEVDELAWMLTMRRAKALYLALTSRRHYLPKR